MCTSNATTNPCDALSDDIRNGYAQDNGYVSGMSCRWVLGGLPPELEPDATSAQIGATTDLC